MDYSSAIARLATALIAVSAVGLLVSLVVGLLATPQYLFPTVVVLVLVAAVVGWLALAGVRGSGGTATTYW